MSILATVQVIILQIGHYVYVTYYIGYCVMYRLLYLYYAFAL